MRVDDTDDATVRDCESENIIGSIDHTNTLWSFNLVSSTHQGKTQVICSSGTILGLLAIIKSGRGPGQLVESISEGT